ncbi:MAG TPA: alpha/beta hydrolase [Vicinamibacterales bacterium]|nr:alpha/beta hydrolase [Vicinamibacterales bacterium]
MVLATPMAGRQSKWVDTSGHHVSMIPVAPGVTLEVLDWGGTGDSLMLLAGLNNTGHIFDDFAHQFTDRFRVLAVTRRGFGASSRPPGDYDTGTLAHDLLAVADKLSIDRVILVGHSIAGDEMTKFAGSYPNRVRALVYLDAAYDRTRSPRATPAPEQPITREDTASVERLEARYARVFGWRLPEGEIRGHVVVDSDGRVTSSPNALDPAVAARILKAVERPAYDKVRCPTLAIYAREEIRSTYPNFLAFDAENKVRAERQIAASKPFQEASIAQFRREARNGRVAVLDAASHYVFLTNESEVVRLVRGFLSEVVSR